MASAMVSNIQKCCVYDGPGLRTVVFLMGCPLRCKWCQNPENLSNRPIVLFDKDKCVSCGRCLPYCPRHGTVVTPDGFAIDRTACTACGECLDACLTEAKTLCGREMTADEVFRAVMRDAVFYRTSGGGVTLSGGEPTLHPSFVIELFALLRAAGVHTAMETCGFCPEQTMRAVAQVTDLFLFDLKAYTEEVHRHWTGQSNEPILRNLRALCEDGREVIVRVPFIPGVNDGAEFDRMLDFLETLPGGPRRLHLLPFHQVGSSKYVLSDTAYELKDLPECTTELAQDHADRATARGFLVNVGGWDAGPKPTDH